MISADHDSRTCTAWCSQTGDCWHVCQCAGCSDWRERQEIRSRTCTAQAAVSRKTEQRGLFGNSKES